MELYLKNQSTSHDFESKKYIEVIACGQYEKLPHFRIMRQDGRVDYQLIYIKSGSMKVTLDNATMTLKSGDIILFRPNELQNYFSDTGETSFCYIHFSGTGVNEALSFFKEKHYQIGPFHEIESFCSSYYESKYIFGNVNDMIFEGKLLTLLGIIHNKITGHYANQDGKFLKIKKAVYYINSYYFKKISIDELAQMCQITKQHFIKLFKEVMGVTPQKYHILLIVAYGKQMLLNTDINISEISSSLGIDDSLYFSRMFKKNVGMSPYEYRKKHS